MRDEKHSWKYFSVYFLKSRHLGPDHAYILNNMNNVVTLAHKKQLRERAVQIMIEDHLCSQLLHHLYPQHNKD